MRRLFLLLTVVWLGCGRSPSPTVFIDPALAVLVPSETSLLAGVRMQRLASSAFYRRSIANVPRLAKFRRDMGFGATTDIWEYLIAYDGVDALTLMRGKFTDMGMEPRLDKQGAKRMSFGGVTVIGDEHGAVGFLNPTTAMAGRMEVVVRALERRNQNAGVPSELAKLAAQIPSANELWLVSTGPAPGFLPVATVRSARIGFDPLLESVELAIEAESDAAARAIATLAKASPDGRRVEMKGVASELIIDWILGRTAEHARSR